MSEANGQVPPVPVLAGHLVIYDGGVVAFRADGAEEVVRPPLPPVIVPLLVKLLSGEELTSDDMPMAGPLMSRVLAAMSRG